MDTASSILRKTFISLLLIWAAITMLAYIMLTPATAVSSGPTPAYHAVVSDDPPYLVATPIVVYPPSHSKGR